MVTGYRRPIFVMALTLVFAAGTSAALINGWTLESLTQAPWRDVDPPYFTANMGEKYQEVPFDEIGAQLDFDVLVPSFRPTGLSPYRAAVKVGQVDRAYFFTDGVPGAEPGRPEGVFITIGPSIRIDRGLQSNAKSTKVQASKAFVYSLGPKEGRGLYMRRRSLGIAIYWFDERATDSGLKRIARFIN